MRARRLVSTPSMAATPVSRNTGATEDWIRCAISVLAIVMGMGFGSGRRAGRRWQFCITKRDLRQLNRAGVILRAGRLLLYDRSTRTPAWKCHEKRPTAPDRDLRVRRPGQPEPAGVDLPRPGVLRGGEALDLPPGLAGGVPPERHPEGGRLPHLRVLRRVGAGGARGGWRGAGLPQCLPPPRRAPGRWSPGPLRQAHHLSLSRLDLRARRAPRGGAEQGKLQGPGHRAPRPGDARARGIPRLRLRTLRTGA